MSTPYYTRTISEEVKKALHEVGFPFPIADMGFTVPQIVEMPVDYASVLDWFLSKNIEINVFSNAGEWKSMLSTVYTDFPEDVHESSFLEAMDKTILLAVEFLKSEKDDNS